MSKEHSSLTTHLEQLLTAPPHERDSLLTKMDFFEKLALLEFFMKSLNSSFIVEEDMIYSEEDYYTEEQMEYSRGVGYHISH